MCPFCIRTIYGRTVEQGVSKLSLISEVNLLTAGNDVGGVEVLTTSVKGYRDKVARKHWYKDSG